MDLRWAIIGAGNIAGVFAGDLSKSEQHQVVAIGSTDQERAKRFIQKHGLNLATGYGSYEEAFADPEVDAVYIATPHVSHSHLSILASEAGKHVLVEKPAGVNAAEVMTMQEAAHEAGTFWMEAFMYRCSPQTEMILSIIQSGEIGDVKLVDASFGFVAPNEPERRLLNPALAGGGIMDVGLYPVSFARLIAGAVEGQSFADPVSISATGALAHTGVDDVAAAVLKFENGMIAQVKTSLAATLSNDAWIYGTLGAIHIPEPWQPGGRTRSQATVTVRPYLGEERAVSVGAGSLYLNEAEAVRLAIETGAQEVSSMRWADSLGNARALDQWRQQIGLTYPFEKTGASFRPPNGQPAPSTSRKTNERSVHVNGLDKPMSRLVMGCDNQTTLPHAAAMFDDYFERGGNVFDTAHLYGGGLMEKLLGQWIESRNVRNDVVVIAKGAHTPDCRPEMVRPQLEESLGRLGTDFADIYFLHRDDTSIPIDEWVCALEEVKAAGMIHVYGGSNWTLERVRQANAYAAAYDCQGFNVVSNNFSLAEMVNPVWPGVLSSNTSEWRSWLTETQTALFPWSSQARGFFSDASNPDRRHDPELSNAWFSDANFARKARVLELAEKLGTSPMAIVAAYVMHQPFPCLPLIGPRSIAETRESFGGLTVNLTPADMEWLELG